MFYQEILKNLPKLRIMALKAIIILFAALTILNPVDAFATDSITYNIAENILNTTQSFSLELFGKIAGAYKDLYIKIAGIGLVIILSKYLFTRVVPVKDLLGFLIAMTISSSIALNADIFKLLVYDTFFEALYNFDQFIVQASASQMPGITMITFNSLSGVFDTIDSSLMGISSFAHDIFTKSSLIFNGAALMIESFIIYFLYLFIGLYFLVIFTVSIFGAHMMIILMPVTLSLYPFKRFRHYFSNCVNGMLHYGLTTVFCCVAISLVVFICNDLVIEAKKLEAEGIEEIPADFLTASIMVGFLSIFLIKMSTEFASRVLNSASSQLGGAFPMIVAGATTMAKMAVSPTSAIASTAIKGARTLGQGTVNAITTGGGYAGKMSTAAWNRVTPTSLPKVTGNSATTKNSK